MSENCCTFASKSQNTITMVATQPIMQQVGTISEEKWDSLHTIDELDTTLKHIIHNHFRG